MESYILSQIVYYNEVMQGFFSFLLKILLWKALLGFCFLSLHFSFYFLFFSFYKHILALLLFFQTIVLVPCDKAGVNLTASSRASQDTVKAKLNCADDGASWRLIELKGLPFILSPFDSRFLIFFANALKLKELSVTVQERSVR